jgi:hypothetical protein
MNLRAADYSTNNADSGERKAATAPSDVIGCALVITVTGRTMLRVTSLAATPTLIADQTSNCKVRKARKSTGGKRVSFGTFWCQRPRQ